MIKQYRKKPVVIEAVQLTLQNMDEVKQWCGGKTWSRAPMRAVTGISLDTLEDDKEQTHFASFNDYIIRGIQGEFYPCKPDIFEATYELVARGADTSAQSTN